MFNNIPFKQQQIKFYSMTNTTFILCEDCKESYLYNIDSKAHHREIKIHADDIKGCDTCDNKPLNLITYREVCVFHGSDAVQLIEQIDTADDPDAFITYLCDHYDIDGQGELYTFDIDCNLRPWGMHDPSYESGLYYISYNINIEVFSIHKLEI